MKKYLIIILMFIVGIAINVHAEDHSFSMPEGIRYTMPEDYDFIFANATNKEIIKEGKGIVGNFVIEGNIHNDGEKNGFPAYVIDDNDIVFKFDVDKSWANSLSSPGWRYQYDLVIKKIDGENIIFYGDTIELSWDALFFQASTDGENWTTYDIVTNLLFETMYIEHSQRDRSLEAAPDFYKTNYETNLYQLHKEGGFYYRIIFEYGLEKKIEKRKLFGPTYDHVNFAEVYQFYISLPENAEASKNDQQYRLGSKVKTGDNFFGTEVIDIKDKHYGWDLGYFFVTGYTEHQEINGNHVFLKNVGDEITLWFNLSQNINLLNGDGKLKIKSDTDITDQNFELPKTNFYHGALIIRKTDYQNITHDPVVYVDFLAANVLPFADTKVELFEEGDYEVALDYSIDKNHYRIAFNYSIRNSNCMIYPFDVVTKSEMVNSSYTENGFYLDLARSRYLDINVKRVAMVNGVEDVRFNRSARDGEQYTDDGIYIITVKNKVTGEQTEKRIYVGADYKQYSQN